MGDRLRTSKPSRYVTSHPGQLSLAIPPWVGAISTGESWGVNRHTAWYTSPVSVVSQCKLVYGWGLRKRRSAPPHGSCGSGRGTLVFLHISCNVYNYTGLIKINIFVRILQTAYLSFSADHEQTSARESIGLLSSTDLITIFRRKNFSLQHLQNSFLCFVMCSYVCCDACQCQRPWHLTWFYQVLNK